MVRDMARRFAQERLKPFSAEWDRSKVFPRDRIAEMGALGLMGMLVPEAFGGSKTDFISYALAIEEIATGDGAISTVMSVHNSVGCGPILGYGTQAQKERFLGPMASGQWLGAFCLTEPHAGSDASALKTRARKSGDRYVLNGTKQFITSGKNADIAIVFAVTDPDAGKRGISAFIVPTNLPGYRVVGIENKLGQNLSDTAQIAFDDLELTGDHLLGAEGEGYRIALSNLESGRIMASEGARLALLDRDNASLRRLAGELTDVGATVTTHQLDCTSETEVRHVFSTIMREIGFIDVLVNNVGQSARERATEFYQSSSDVWQSVINVSLMATLLASRQVVPAMREAARGKIVNIASTAGLSGEVRVSEYSAAKMGVIGFTRSLAQELAPFGVNVNAVCPGVTNTQAVKQLPADFVASITAKIPMRRLADPEDIAATIAFLASADARHITGQSIVVDGGNWMV